MIIIFILVLLLLGASIMGLILAIIFFIQIITIKAPYVKTPPRVIEKIFSEIKINPQDIVYDLGCGDASFLIAVEKKFGAQTIGFELSPIAYCRAKQKIKREQAKTKLFFKSFFKQTISDADVVFCFLVPGIMEKVGTYLESQLKRNAQVISYAFPIPQWQPSKILDTLPNGNQSSKIYIYNK